MPLIPIAIPVQQPRMMFFDADGKPLVGGKVYSLKIGTDLFKPTFCNANHTALNQNPIVLDEAGSALIYMTGNHLLKIYDKFDNFIEMRFLPVTQMRTYFYDKLGKPLKFGKVETYDIASTIKKTSYTSSEQTVTNPNPVILDENGSAIICIVGSYRLRVYDSNDVFLWDQDYQRVPAFVLTSKPYQLYLEESLIAQIWLDPSVQKTELNGSGLDDSVVSFFAVDDAVAWSIFNDTHLDEALDTSFLVNNAIWKVTINTTNLDEQIQSNFTVNTGVQSTVLVSTSMEIQNLSTSFAVNDAQLG